MQTEFSASLLQSSESHDLSEKKLIYKHTQIYLYVYMCVCVCVCIYIYIRGGHRLIFLI